MEKIPKDIYEYIAYFADDKTVLNMLSVNKKFNNEEIFFRIISKRYPLLIKFKSNRKTWRRFYIKMIYYIAKNYLEYEIPYISHEEFNPYKFYKENTDRHNCENKFDIIMEYALEIQRMDIVKLMIKKGARSFSRGLICASKTGNINNVRFMIKKGATCFDLGIKYAAKYNHLKIVKLMLEKGATKINKAIYYAAKNGYDEILKFLFAFVNSYLGKQSYLDNKNNIKYSNIIMKGAARAGNIKKVSFMIENGADDFNQAMKYASKGGNLDIVKLFLKKGATNLNEPMKYAAKYGHIDIIKLLIIHERSLEQHTYESINFNESIKYAAEHGYINIVELLLTKGVTNFDDAIKAAILNDHINIFTFLLDKKDDNLNFKNYVKNWFMNEMMEYAANKNRLEIVKLLIEKGATNFTLSIEAAAANGHLKIVKFLYDTTGSNKMNISSSSILYANNGGHRKVVNFLSSCVDQIK